MGSADTDLITCSDTVPRAGETLFGRNFSLSFGGKGANQAVAARLRGVWVAGGGPSARKSFVSRAACEAEWARATR